MSDGITFPGTQTKTIAAGKQLRPVAQNARALGRCDCRKRCNISYQEPLKTCFYNRNGRGRAGTRGQRYAAGASWRGGGASRHSRSEHHGGVWLADCTRDKCEPSVPDGPGTRSNVLTLSLNICWPDITSKSSCLSMEHMARQRTVAPPASHHWALSVAPKTTRSRGQATCLSKILSAGPSGPLSRETCWRCLHLWRARPST